MIWGIWFSMKNSMFENKTIPIKSVTNIITVVVLRTGNISHDSMFSSIYEFSFLKSFSISCHARAPPNIKKIDWHPHKCDRIKCNTDGAAKGSPCQASCGDIFGDHMATILGFFAANLGISFSFMLNCVEQ